MIARKNNDSWLAEWLALISRIRSRGPGVIVSRPPSAD